MMTHEQRAVQVWSVLVFAARSQQILSYLIMEHLTGVQRHLQAPILGKVEEYCKRKHLPKLTSILVNEGGGLPGDLYPGHQEEAGLEVFREQCRVFVFDWFKSEAPSEHDFGTP